MAARFSGEKPENRLSAKMPLLRWIPEYAAGNQNNESPVFLRFSFRPLGRYEDLPVSCTGKQRNTSVMCDFCCIKQLKSLSKGVLPSFDVTVNNDLAIENSRLETLLLDPLGPPRGSSRWCPGWWLHTWPVSLS